MSADAQKHINAQIDKKKKKKRHRAIKLTSFIAGFN